MSAFSRINKAYILYILKWVLNAFIIVGASLNFSSRGNSNLEYAKLFPTSTSYKFLGGNLILIGTVVSKCVAFEPSYLNSYVSDIDTKLIMRSLNFAPGICL